jgi:predicted nucleic-acid-binding protein
VIGLDTNVLLRAVLGDDRIWSTRAERFLNENCNSGNPGYINAIVLAEAFWVLRGQSGFDKAKLIDFIEGLLDSENFLIADEAAVALAVQDYATGQAGFADYLIARLNEVAGATPTYAVDKAATKNSIFRPLPDKETT